MKIECLCCKKDISKVEDRINWVLLNPFRYKVFCIECSLCILSQIYNYDSYDMKNFIGNYLKNMSFNHSIIQVDNIPNNTQPCTK